MQGQQTAHPIVTVDIVIPRLTATTLEVLLIKRRNDPFGDAWALPGGKLNVDDPDLEAAVLRELREETGITIPASTLRQVQTFGDAERDPRGRYVSVLYTLAEPLGEDIQARAGDDASEVRWFPALIERPALAFDHEKLIDWAIQFLFTWQRINHPGLERLDVPVQCMVGSECGERCPLPAFWSVNGWAMCEEDLRAIADMNSDNEEIARSALQAMSEGKGQEEGESKKTPPALTSVLRLTDQPVCLQRHVPVTVSENDIRTADLWMSLGGCIYTWIDGLPYSVDIIHQHYVLTRDEYGGPVGQGV